MRSCITFRNLSSSKIILGSTRKYFNGPAEMWALFSGSKGVLTSPPTLPENYFELAFKHATASISDLFLARNQNHFQKHLGTWREAVLLLEIWGAVAK